MGHLDSGPADLGPWKIITEAAVQTHDLQKRCPQPKAYGLKTSSWKQKNQQKLLHPKVRKKKRKDK